jgi:hypothetical protein
MRPVLSVRARDDPGQTSVSDGTLGVDKGYA